MIRGSFQARMMNPVMAAINIQHTKRRHRAGKLGLFIVIIITIIIRENALIEMVITGIIFNLSLMVGNRSHNQGQHYIQLMAKTTEMEIRHHINGWARLDQVVVVENANPLDYIFWDDWKLNAEGAIDLIGIY